jgi:molecular chaperone IbpA
MVTQFAMDLFKDPFFIGFNRELERFNSLSKVNNTAFPPYDLLKLNEDNYKLSLAVAGFTKDDLTVSIEDGSLWITGEIKEVVDAEVVHKGIAARKFTRIFELSEYMEVSDVELKDGMLHINVVRNIPKEKQPKVLKIK